MKPMTNEEATDFGRQTMKFGKYSGQQIKDVPMDYLLWLDEQPDFRKQLARYLANERIQNEQEGPEEEPGW